MLFVPKIFVLGLFVGALNFFTVHVSSAFAAEGLYAGIAVGFSNSSDTTASGTSGGKVKFDKGNFNNGTMGAVFVGHDYGSNIRAEIEVARRAADLKSVSGNAGNGEALATSLMMNVFYDVAVDLPIQPYVGLGLGFAQVKMDGASPFGGSVINDSDRVGAFQAIVGARYALTDQIDLFGDYRYFKTADADLTTRTGIATSMDFSAHSGVLGLRYAFGGTSSAVVSSNGEANGVVQSEMNNAVSAKPQSKLQPEPQASSQAGHEALSQTEPQSIALALKKTKPVRALPDTYVVYFVLNKADVTADGIKIIQQVADNAKTMGVTRLHLTGHTDRSGKEQYNLDLSKRRAEAVRVAFVALGFGAANISIKAKGEAEPEIDIGGKEYEPKNRRVEIVLP